MIEVQYIHKTYHVRGRGDVDAVNNVSFVCRPGEVFGLLGPNGAGKTTILRMISTALKPTKGKAKVIEFDVVQDAAEVRRRVGFLSANTGLYGRLTAREVLIYFGRLFGMHPHEIKSRLDEVTEIFALEEFLSRPCDKLSSGMKQRVSIARAVFHDPPVMIFDEPTTGLDVVSSRAIVNFIKRCKGAGKTVIFSTHIMSEVEQLCDQVALIHHGRLCFEGTTECLRTEHGEPLEHAFLSAIGENV